MQNYQYLLADFFFLLRVICDYTANLLCLDFPDVSIVSHVINELKRKKKIFFPGISVLRTRLENKSHKDSEIRK